MKTAEKIKIETTVKAPIEKVWEYFTEAKHIVNWNFASDDWHCPRAENDFKEGESFSWRMESKDGKHGFDFSGTYTSIYPQKSISYTIDDERKVDITFEKNGNEILLTEVFEAENSNPIEMQKGGWQAILDNFKKYVEKNHTMKRLNFEININAPADKVYHCMLDKPTYNRWTTVFSPSSDFESTWEGSWEKGSHIYFVGTNEKGQKEGMISRIKENIPNKYVSIEHLGMIQDGKEITSAPEVDSWAGALENYRFSSVNGGTKIEVEVDTNSEFEAFFKDSWPKALDKLKEICEN